MAENKLQISQEMMDIVWQYDPKVQQMVIEALESRLRDILIDLQDTESPIEQLMAVALSKRVGNMTFPAALRHQAIVMPQMGIECAKKKYRADFLLLVGDISDHDEMLKIVVECDGHDFHEKTKQQATRDKRRDRDMLAAGYNVLRFTGQEVWKDPLACAKEVSSTIRSLHTEKWGRG